MKTKPLKPYTILLLIILAFLRYPTFGQNQGINNWWIMGYDGWGNTLPFGNTFIDFNSGIPVLSHTYLQMEFNHTHANISDEYGNLLFYTNGYYIADANNDTMLNGTGINPSSYTSFFSDGLSIPQANIILPNPSGSGNLYYFFHSTVDKYPGYTHSAHIYLSTIDMSMNNGLGAVVQKNQIILSDSLNGGKLTACKHANGRDWWIMCHRINSNKFYKFLLTPFGVSGPFDQNIGVNRPFDAGQAKFSPDGSKYAYYYYNVGLEIFDFDRCTGDLSNPIFISQMLGVGVEFSPNSQYLYTFNGADVFQFDLNAANIYASLDTVAIYDGFLSGYSPWPSLPTYFTYSALAPDGKIYITTGNSTLHMHTIDNPDVLGVGCNVNQHSVQLPAFYFNTLPNHPNYFLGKIPGSPCDTITGLGTDEFPYITAGVYPNPSTGNLMLNIPVQSVAGELEVYDLNGRLAHKEYVAPWSQFKRLDLSHLNKSIYLIKVRWNNSIGQVKVVIE